jgi:hypothetical protein
MNAVLDNSLVGLALVASVGYALVALSPRNARRRGLGRLAEWLFRAPKALRLESAAQRLARAADAKGSCGGCDTCGSESKPQSSDAEIRVPISSIARARSPRQE